MPALRQLIQKGIGGLVAEVAWLYHSGPKVTRAYVCMPVSFVVQITHPLSTFVLTTFPLSIPVCLTFRRFACTYHSSLFFQVEGRAPSCSGVHPRLSDQTPWHMNPKPKPNGNSEFVRPVLGLLQWYDLVPQCTNLFHCLKQEDSQGLG